MRLMTQDIRSLTQMLTDARTSIPKDSEDLSLGQILEIFHERGFGFILFLFALPAAIPLPAIGINLIIAIPLLFLTVQQMIGRHTIWFPQSIRNKKIKTQRFNNFLDASVPWMKHLEFFIRPRFGFITQGLFSCFIGLCGFIMALSVCVPLPLTNTVPSMGIALMALGVVMRDGLAVIGGMLIGLCWIALLVLILIFIGVEGFDLINVTIKAYIL